jgi:hypothetical protein
MPSPGSRTIIFFMDFPDSRKIVQVRRAPPNESQ